MLIVTFFQYVQPGLHGESILCIRAWLEGQIGNNLWERVGAMNSWKYATCVSVFFMLVTVLAAADGLFAAEPDSTLRCGDIALEEAAAILGVPVGDVVRSSTDIMVSPEEKEKNIYTVPPYTCSFRSQSNFLKTITYMTYIYADKKRAHREFLTMKNGFAAVAAVESVDRLGEEVFWVGDSRFQRMVAVQGNTVIDVLAPKEASLQKSILRLVLAPL